jgi:hypothetical protein
MKILFPAILLLVSSLSLAECNRPAAPVLPDGDTSDMQAMIDGQKAVKAYVTGTDAYLDCLTTEDTEVGAEANPDAALARVNEHNAAVDEMEKVAAEFNEEIREYKKKSQ